MFQLLERKIPPGLDRLSASILCTQNRLQNNKVQEVFHVVIVLNSCFRILTLGLLLSLGSQKKESCYYLHLICPSLPKDYSEKCGGQAQ